MLGTTLICGIEMIEEGIKPFEKADEPPHSTTGFHPLDSRVVSLWRVSGLIGFGVLLLTLLIPVVTVGVAEPRSLIWLVIVWLAVASGAVWFCVWDPPRLYRSWGFRLCAEGLGTPCGRGVQRA